MSAGGVGGSEGADNLSMFAKQTLMQQFRELSRQPPENVSVGLHNDKLSEWEVSFFGPANSLIEGAIFPAVIMFPSDFPNQPPKVQFVGKYIPWRERALSPRARARPLD